MPTVSGIIVSTGSQSTGRRAFSEVIDELARTLDASDSTIRALAGDAFRSAVRTMNRKGLWPWEILQEDITQTANDKHSTVLGSVKKPLAMHHLTEADGTPDREIDYVSYDRFVEKYTLDVTAQTTLYTIPNLFETGQIRWFPTPASIDYFRFTYYRITPAPRVESETIEVPDYAIDVYMAFAWLEFCKRLSSAQRPMPIQVALEESGAAFRQLSAHVGSPGDRSRGII